MPSGGSGGRVPSGGGCGGGIGCGSGGGIRGGVGFGFGGWVFGGARNECVHRGLAVKNAELRGPEPEHCGTRVRGHVVDIYSLGGSHIAEGNAIDTVPP